MARREACLNLQSSSGFNEAAPWLMPLGMGGSGSESEIESASETGTGNGSENENGIANGTGTGTGIGIGTGKTFDRCVILETIDLDRHFLAGIHPTTLRPN